MSAKASNPDYPEDGSGFKTVSVITKHCHFWSKVFHCSTIVIFYFTFHSVPPRANTIVLAPWYLGLGRFTLQAVFHTFVCQFDFFVSGGQVRLSWTIAVSHLRHFNKEKAMSLETYTKQMQQCANTELATGTYNWQSQQLLRVLHNYVFQVKTIWWFQS